MRTNTDGDPRGKQVKQDCAVCHKLSVLINGREYGDGEAVTLRKGETHTVKVKDTPVPRDTPPGGDSSPPHTSNQKFTVWPQAVDGQTITSIQGNGAADSPQVFIAKKAEILQYLLDNSEGLMAQDKDWPENPADEPMNKTARLLPVEVKDIKDHANTGDDVVISNRTKGETITDASVAWIEAHKSATDNTPRMPQLVFNILGFPQGVSLEAKLLVEYERPYAGKQADDTVKIPANGSFKSITNGRWEIWNDYSNLSFFGGDATLTYKINGGEEQTIRFAIGGRNPDDLRCKAYTQGRPGSPWYAYAIEKSESQSYNAGFYNQFWERSGNSTPVNPGAVNYVFTKGDPLVIRTPPETGVGGAGLAQVTGAGGVKTVSAPREIFWNWQKNVDAFLNILAGKVAEAESAMNNPNPRNPPNPRPDGQRPQSRFDTGNFVSVPLIFNGVDKGTQGRIKFSDNSNHKRPEDAVAIKRYNGAQADWCSWAGSSVSDTANHHWQWNYGANDYVTKVSNQVEEQQP